MTNPKTGTFLLEGLQNDFILLKALSFKLSKSMLPASPALNTVESVRQREAQCHIHVT